MKVAICVVTYLRPDGVRKLLESLVSQQGLDGDFGIVVVDNDPAGSAWPIVEEFTSGSIPIEYALESDPGIPAARNRSIAIARECGASVVAFIDDDEFASPYWIATMYQRLELSGADAISGPVEPIIPAAAPAWARRTRLYHRATFADGARLDYASTANSMLRLSAIAGNLQPFNPDFRFSGGSDTYLYQSLRAAGRTIIWEPAALIYEDVPLSRISLQWIVARGYRQGTTLARCDRLIRATPRRLATRFTRGALQIPLGLTECAFGIAQGNDRWRNGLVRIARGAGVIAGLAGRTYDEYRR